MRESFNFKETMRDKQTSKLISFDTFYDASNLQKLSLSYNRLGEIDSCLFKGLYKLRELDLKLNFLNELNLTLFDDFTQLELLDLSNNEFTILRLFDRLRSLKTIIFSANKLITLDIQLFDGLNKLILI